MAEGVRAPDNIEELSCEVCMGVSHEEKIVLCDKCDKGFHMYCLSPPMEGVPRGDWVCPRCLVTRSAHTPRPLARLPRHSNPEPHAPAPRRSRDARQPCPTSAVQPDSVDCRAACFRVPKTFPRRWS